LQAFSTELSTLEAWLEKSSLYLEDLSKADITDNVENIQHKLGQIRSFSQEIDKTKPQIEALRTSANGILEKSEANFANLLNSKLHTVAYKWNDILDETRSLSDKYESALKKNDDVSIYNSYKRIYKCKRLLYNNSVLLDYKWYRRFHKVVIEFRKRYTCRFKNNIFS